MGLVFVGLAEWEVFRGVVGCFGNGCNIFGEETTGQMDVRMVHRAKFIRIKTNCRIALPSSESLPFSILSIILIMYNDIYQI